MKRSNRIRTSKASLVGKEGRWQREGEGEKELGKATISDFLGSWRGGIESQTRGKLFLWQFSNFNSSGLCCYSVISEYNSYKSGYRENHLIHDQIISNIWLKQGILLPRKMIYQYLFNDSVYNHNKSFKTHDIFSFKATLLCIRTLNKCSGWHNFQSLCEIW